MFQSAVAKAPYITLCSVENTLADQWPIHQIETCIVTVMQLWTNAWILAADSFASCAQAAGWGFAVGLAIIANNGLPAGAMHWPATMASCVSMASQHWIVATQLNCENLGIQVMET